MIAEQILRQLREFGYTLAIENGECALVAKVPGAILPKNWLGEFLRHKEKHKRELLKMCECDECGRIVTDLEDMDVLKTNHYLCDRAKCPFKRRN